MKPKGKKPLGKVPELPEAESDAASTPDARDIQNADALAETDEVLSALWNATPHEEKKDAV